MTTSPLSKVDAPDPVQATPTAAPSSSSPLVSDQGSTTIADAVVQKIAGLAAREVPGVFSLGGGVTRAIGALRERIPGGTQSVTQGVRVEVGASQAAVDLDLVVEYGVSIAAVAEDIRTNVVRAIEQMTGLEVTEVNIAVDDVHLPEDEDAAPRESRVV